MNSLSESDYQGIFYLMFTTFAGMYFGSTALKLPSCTLQHSSKRLMALTRASVCLPARSVQTPSKLDLGGTSGFVPFFLAHPSPRQGLMYLGLVRSIYSRCNQPISRHSLRDSVSFCPRSSVRIRYLLCGRDT